MSKIKLDVGRFVRIRFDDIGVVDGLVTDFDGSLRGWRGYFPIDGSIDRFESSQVVEIGPYVKVPKF